VSKISRPAWAEDALPDPLPLSREMEPPTCLSPAPLLAPDASHIPAELMQFDQWVVWRLQNRGGQSTKVGGTPPMGYDVRERKLIPNSVAADRKLTHL
jgi:hypothetical protein